MNSLFRSSVPGASPGRQRDDADDLSVGHGRDPHIAGSDVLWGDPEGGRHQCHEPRIVNPIPPSSGKKDPTARMGLLEPGRPDVKYRAHQWYARHQRRCAQPALVFRQIAAPVQPGHALGAPLEGRGQRLLADLVATALTGKV